MVDCTPLISDPNICGFLVETIFPWLFSFAIIYGLVLRSKVFGDTADTVNRGISGIIGIVAAFLVAMTAGPYIGALLASVSGTVVAFAIVILGIVLLFTIINPGLLQEFKGGKGLVIIGAIILIAGAIVSGITPGFTAITLGQDLLALIVILIIVGALVWFVTATGGPEEKKETP